MEPKDDRTLDDDAFDQMWSLSTYKLSNSNDRIRYDSPGINFESALYFFENMYVTFKKGCENVEGLITAIEYAAAQNRLEREQELQIK